ncbi:MAG TPA: hypothetical protein VND22_08835 [Actinomycetota bacterium]|nr:hypothetical protein [Actinomycetota bacterium]
MAKRLVRLLLVLLLVSALMPAMGLASTAAAPTPTGFWNLGQDGGVFTHGTADFYGSLPGRLSALGLPQVNDVVGMASTPSGHGYWIAQSGGGVHAFGDAQFLGSMQSLGLTPAAPIIAIVSFPALSDPEQQGYWLFGADGGVITFGAAGFFGSMAGIPLESPVVDAATASDGEGYIFIERLGGLHIRGSAIYKGNIRDEVRSPVVGVHNFWFNLDGYWGVEANGGVHARGSAPFRGSAFGATTAPISGITSPSASGYWLVGLDGNVYEFNVPDHGNDVGPLAAPIIDIEAKRFSGANGT